MCELVVRYRSIVVCAAASYADCASDLHGCVALEFRPTTSFCISKLAFVQLHTRKPVSFCPISLVGNSAASAIVNSTCYAVYRLSQLTSVCCSTMSML